MDYQKLQSIINQDHILIDLNVSQIGDDQYLAAVHGTVHDPKNILERGGPVTIKSMKFQAVGKTFEESQEKALIGVAKLLGLDK